MDEDLPLFLWRSETRLHAKAGKDMASVHSPEKGNETLDAFPAVKRVKSLSDLIFLASK
jgi:hypothetical protein